MLKLRHIDSALCMLIITLIAVMNALKDNPIKYVAMMLYGGLLLVSVAPRITSFGGVVSRLFLLRSNWMEYFLVIWIFLTTFAYVRAFSHPELRTNAIVSMAFFFSLVLFAMTTIRQAALRADFHILRSILYSTHIFILLNFIGYLLGFRGEIEFINSGEYGEAKLLALLGIHADRTLFPLSPGLTTFGVVAGASFCLAVVAIIKCQGKERWMNLLMFIISSIALLLSDSRGSILFCIISLSVFGIISFRRKLYLAKHLIFPFSLLFLGLLTLSLLAATSGQGTDYSRGNLLLSGREVVWTSAFSALGENPLMSLIGYGYMGHYVSGVSKMYAFLFDNWEAGAGEFFTLHNFLLQLIFDVGIFGYCVMFLVIYSVLQRLGELDRVKIGIAPLAVMYLLYSVAAGASESAFSVYSFTTFSPILIMLCFVSYLKRECGNE